MSKNCRKVEKKKKNCPEFSLFAKFLSQKLKKVLEKSGFGKNNRENL